MPNFNEDAQWFTEINSDNGCAFSLAISQHLHSEQTLYQKIDIFDTQHFGRLMTIDGFCMLSSRDNFIYHEMLVHPALLSHPNPKQVAIIGGGDCGSLQAVLQHRCVDTVFQIEIDAAVTRLAKQYFPELCTDNQNPKAQLLFEDGIHWINAAPSNSLDIIIVDSTDPIGPAKGLFTPEFYQQCRRALNKNGILVQQSESPLLHLESIIIPMHQAMQQVGFIQTQLIQFPLPIYPSGWWTATLAHKHFPATIRQDNSLKTKYYTPTIHTASLALPAFVGQALGKI